MIVVFDGKRLEAPLIKMTGPGRVIMGVPAHRVRVREAAEESSQLAVASGTQDEMPMIGHYAVREKIDGELFVCLF